LYAVVVPVGLWAGYHTLQAYSNWLLVIPAFISGLILVALLEVAKTFIAPILAHGIPTEWFGFILNFNPTNQKNDVCGIQEAATEGQYTRIRA
jgi:hypothetical protein